MPDEKPKHKSGTDDGQGKASSGRSARSKEDAAPPKAANGTKPTSKEAPASDQSPATERPPKLSPPPPTSLYVVEVDNKTGIAAKIEHLDEKTGERKELTDQEYKRIFPFGRPGRRPAPVVKQITAPSRSVTPPLKGRPAPTLSQAPFSAENTELVQAYYRGVADYIKALTSLW